MTMVIIWRYKQAPDIIEHTENKVQRILMTMSKLLIIAIKF